MIFFGFLLTYYNYLELSVKFMTTSKGVLTIAHTKPKYVRQAVNLARSIRLRDPNLPLAIATDFEASAFDGLYDHIIPWVCSR